MCMPKNIGRTNANSDAPSVTFTTEIAMKAPAWRWVKPKGSNVFCILSSLLLPPSATTAVFGYYLSPLLLTNTGEVLPIHMFGEVLREPKDERGPLSI
jgi:hypothetical protein